MNIKYLGHSAFEIQTLKGNILIDPFLVMSKNYIPKNILNIFVTHAHGDHLGSAIEISKATKAPIVAPYELANYCAKNGCYAIDINPGASFNLEFGKCIVVPACHSSSTPDGKYAGCPVGYVFKIEDKTIYHAGDTSLIQEMKTIGELYSPDVAMLPVGGKYTMDIEQAVIASKWLNAKKVIPMHYNTFEAIKVDIKDFEQKILALGKTPLVLPIEKQEQEL